jgi:indolepyruvate ferredoxin oxidoreductase
VTAGEVDTYLVFDLLVGLSPTNLAGATAGRTLAVVSTTRTPTGRMITDPYAVFPPIEPLLAELDAATRGADNVHLDAAAVAAGLFGDTTTANVVLLGAAYQRGGLPIAAAAIEQAIELNGAAVEANKLAFRWGRMWVQDRARVEAAMQAPDWGVPAPSKADVKLIGDLDTGELGRVLRLRVPDLVAFQDRAYAARYMDTVRLVAAAEARAVPGETAFAEAVARGLHKLMAYKDEYEVARLHLLAVERARVTAELGEDVEVSYNLHPPVLRALGMKNKVRLGPWFSPAMAALAAGKRLRGTAADPFGRAKVRRVERELIDEYRTVVEAVAAALTAANHADAVALAGLPDLVRGYEDIKLRNVERYHAALAEARARLGV